MLSLAKQNQLRGCQQLSLCQLTARGAGVKVVVCKSMMKSPTTIFYTVIKTTFQEIYTSSSNVSEAGKNFMQQFDMRSTK